MIIAKAGSDLRKLIAENLAPLGFDFYLELVLICCFRGNEVVECASRLHGDFSLQLIYLNIIFVN